MDIDVLFCNFRGPANYVQLLVNADAKPNMSPVIERLRHSLEAEDTLVKSCASLQIAHMNSLVVKFCGFLGSACLCER